MLSDFLIFLLKNLCAQLGGQRDPFPPPKGPCMRAKKKSAHWIWLSLEKLHFNNFILASHQYSPFVQGIMKFTVQQNVLLYIEIIFEAYCQLTDL